MRGGITLECTESKRRNYRTTKNKNKKKRASVVVVLSSCSFS